MAGSNKRCGKIGGEVHYVSDNEKQNKRIKILAEKLKLSKLSKVSQKL